MKRFTILVWVCLLFAATTVFADMIKESRPMIPKELRPSEKVRESFEAVRKVGFVGDEFTGWFVAPGIIVTAGHKHIAGSVSANEVKAFIGDKQGKTETAQRLYYNVNEDLALFRMDNMESGNYVRVIKIRTEPPRPKELLWWSCKSGLLENEWSVGVYLKKMPRLNESEYRRTGYLITALIGGNSSGCSGSPVLDSEGMVVARISAYVPSSSATYAGGNGSEKSDISFPNVVAAGIDGVEHALAEVESPVPKLQSPTLPDWMMPPDAVRNNFAGIVEINLRDGETRTYGSAWFVSPDVVVAGGHYYNKAEISENAIVQLTDRRGIIHSLAKLPIGNKDIALFKLLDDNHGLPVLPLREEKLDENGDELLWWYCASGLLRDEWSMGRFLGEIPPAGALAGVFQENVYLINTIAGGIHAGCTGAPVMDYQGRVVGFAAAFIPGGSFNNILVIRAEDIQRAVKFAESMRGGK